MNLVFNFKNKLFWIHNFLPPNLYKEMYLEYFHNRKKLNFEKTMINWKTFKEETDNMSKSFDQKNKIKHNFFKKYHTFLQHQKFVNLIGHKMQSHLRKYQFNQHATWHSDLENNRTYGATYYFNHRWGESWGGEFMFKSEEGSGFIPIVGNSIIIVKVGLKHKVNANLKKTHNRLSIQTFLNK